MSELTIAQVLREAEQVIGQRGWCQGGLTDSAGRVDAQGAVNAAITGHPRLLGRGDQAYRLAGNALDALAEHVGGGVPGWNDTTGRMAIEVRHALLVAARGLEAKDAQCA